MRRLVLTALAATSAVGLLAGCGGGSSAGGDPTGGAADGPIAVAATDTTCDVALASAPAGVITFKVQNTGTKINEFYMYGPGDQILGEVENITPGLSREFRVEVTQAGTYQTACKPGMVGDGIRNTFTVTGTAAAAASGDENLSQAIETYTAYVNRKSDQLVDLTTEFVDHVKAGEVEQAKALFPIARAPWEEIEPVAESFGDLDPRVDGREDVIAEGMKFTGFHRLEKDLWVDGLQDDSSAIADMLLTDVKEIASKAKAVEFNALRIANGAKALLDEVATGKITGEEDRYSHTDLWDFFANVKGSEQAIASLRPALEERDPELVTALDARFDAVFADLDSYREGDGFMLYTDLTKDDIKKLTVSLDALSETVSKVAAVVEK